MKIIITICITVLLLANIAFAERHSNFGGDSYTTTYDSNWNKTGHSVRDSSGKVTTYDKNWNKTGYEIRESRGTVKVYDKNWNKIGTKTHK